MATRKIMFRKLSLAAFSAVTLLTASNLAALGLGALEVRSNLDQPLDGTIELRVASGDDVGSVTAAIASVEDFEKLGIDYPSYLQDLSLSVENMGGNTYVLRVVSNDVIIKEPFIHFLVRVDWAGGSFLREYTALIDPPVYASEAPQSVAEPVVVGTDEAYQSDSADIAAEELETNEAEVVDDIFDETSTVEDSEGDIDETTQDLIVEETEFNSETIPTDAQYGPVAGGETLSLIAAELQRQFPDLSIYQIMQVLFEENQDAFIDRNINGLMKGVVLNLGDLNAIRQVDVVAAKRFFYEQLTEWDPSVLLGNKSTDDGLRVGQDEYSLDDPIAANDASSSFDSGNVGTGSDTFQVGSSSETDALVSTADGGSNAGEVLALQQQISELETSLSSSQLENQELTERISLLEGQLADMNRLISMDVESADLAAVEATLAAQNNASEIAEDGALEDGALDDAALDATESEAGAVDDLATDTTGFVDPLADLVDESGSVDEENVVSDDELASQNAADEAAATTLDGDTNTGVADANVESDEAATAAVTPVKPISAKSSSFMSKLTDDGLWKTLAGVGGLIVAGLGFWLWRRRRADEEFEISMLSIESHSQSESTSTTQSVTTEREVTAAADEDKSKTADRETSFLTVYSDSDAVVQADEVDPVAEADVYIAYGRDEQAEEVLLDGIASKPGRVDIKQKLLSLYHKNNNVEGFERISEELYSQKNFLTRDVWQEVSLMGKDIAPENPLFDVTASELLAEDDESANMITSGDTGSSNDTDNGSEAEASDDLGIELAKEDPSINLINFDDDQSEISELDEVEIADLEVAGEPENKEQSAAGADVAAENSAAAEVDDDSVFEIDFANESEDTGTDTAAGEREEIDANSDIDIPTVTEVSDLDIADDYDEARTQYELAKVFVDLGDEDGARKILDDIVANNDNNQEVLDDAAKLLESINT